MSDIHRAPALRKLFPGGRTRQAAHVSWDASKAYARLIAVPIAFLGLFFVWPLLRVLSRSVTEPSLGLSNYERILSGGPYLRVLLTTLQTAFSVTAICLLIAYPFAVYVASLRPSRANFMTGLLLIPLWTSVVIRSYAWMILFQKNGVLNEALIGLGWLDQPLQILQTSIAVQIGMVHILLPFMMLPLINNLRSLDRTLLRAGEVLGAGPVKLFLCVYLPLSMPGIAAGVSLVFISALGFYVTPALLGGASNTMLAVLIEQQASTFLDWPLASALASMLLAVTAAIYFTANWFIGPGKELRP